MTGNRLVELTHFVHDGGACWVSPLPDDCPSGAAPGVPASSTLMLFEDGVELGPAAVSHDDIRHIGHGAYSHWGRSVYLSASDNTDPVENGRRYVAVVCRRSAARTDTESDAGAPVNYQLREPTAEAIDADARYAITVANSYVQALPDGRASLKGIKVLELGPGPHFGSALVLLCWGAASVAVADRFLARFQPHYHVPLYTRLRELLVESHDYETLGALEQCLRGGDHEVDHLVLQEAPLETLDASLEGAYDVTVSNAVFEHLFNPGAAARSLFAITAPGGLGLHQVDFRDHRNFDAPLEFLLMDELGFAEEFRNRHGETGNRMRPHQLAELLRAAGFEDIAFDCTLFADNEYLREFEPRLRNARASSFSLMPIDQLASIGGRFVFRRPLSREPRR